MSFSTISVDGPFVDFVETTIVRVHYLLPGIQLEYNSDTREIEILERGGHELENVAKEINYALYREKIYHETLPLRSKILGD